MKPVKGIFLKIMLLLLVVSLEGLGILYGFQHIITYGLLPLLYLSFIHLNKLSFFSLRDRYNNIFLLVIFWLSLVTVVAIHPEVAWENIITLLGVWLTMLLTAEVIRYNPQVFIKWLLICFVIGYWVLSILMYNNLRSNFNINDIWINRSTEELGLNANKYSYYSYFAIMALFYLIEMTRKNIYIILSLGTTIWAAYVSFMVASRSGMLFLILLALVYWIFIFGANRKYKLFRFLIVFVMMMIAANKLYSTYQNSYLQVRNERSIENGDSRTILAKKALNVFMDHPFIGVGPGQFIFYSGLSHFSHNAYTEMAANAGIVGISLLLVILFGPLLTAIRNFYNGMKVKYPEIRKLNILFFSTFILYNNLYVFYITTFGMMFFVIVLYIQKMPQSIGSQKRKQAAHPADKVISTSAVA